MNFLTFIVIVSVQARILLDCRNDLAEAIIRIQKAIPDLSFPISRTWNMPALGRVEITIANIQIATCQVFEDPSSVSGRFTPVTNLTIPHLHVDFAIKGIRLKTNGWLGSTYGGDFYTCLDNVLLRVVDDPAEEGRNNTQLELGNTQFEFRSTNIVANTLIRPALWAAQNLLCERISSEITQLVKRFWYRAELHSTLTGFIEIIK